MKTLDELRSEARVAHEIETAVRREGKFWQLVAILAVIFGGIVGAGVVRCGFDQTPNTLLDVGAAGKVVQLAADLDECRRSWVEPAPANRPWCRESISHYACAIEWRFFLAGSPGWIFIEKDKHWWLVTWDQHEAEIPTP